MADITKPDANPIVAALLSCIWGIGHLVINGQQRKWIFSVVAWFIGTLLFCFPGTIVAVLSIIDTYQTAERLQKGETIGDNEYTFVLYFKIIKIIDKTATCKNA